MAPLWAASVAGALATAAAEAAGPAPRLVTYIDNLSAWWPPTAIAAGLAVPGYAKDNAYNVVNLAFWLSTGPADAALVWGDALKYVSTDNPWGPTKEAVQKAWLQKFHEAGKKVIVSAFGATDMPTSGGKDATKTCTDLANFVKENHLDGVDLDWEDNSAMEAGHGEVWLIDCIRAVRQVLPSGQYLLTMAPQGPYFMGSPKYPGGGMVAVHKAVGELVDWYNVQFYNQGTTKYDQYESLFQKADGWATGTSVAEMHAHGIPLEKIVVGKPVTTADADNTGFVAASNLAAMFSKAKAELGWNAGMMDWQFSSDKDGSFVHTAATGLTATSVAPTSRVGGLPTKMVGLYLLLADDTTAYPSSKDWTPQLPDYMTGAAGAAPNVFWLAFVNPETMQVPPAMARLAKSRPAGSTVIASVGGYSYSMKPNPWPFLTSVAAAEAMAAEVAQWSSKYGLDGVDLDIESGAGDAASSGPNMVAFIRKLRELNPNMIITQPVFGYPQVAEENYVVNEGWKPGAPKGPDSVGIMVYSGTDALQYVKNYRDATKQWQGFPITSDVPAGDIVLGMGGDASASDIQKMAQAVHDQSLGGIMVWYASVKDSATGQPAIQYGGGQADASIKATLAEWGKALQVMGNGATKNYRLLVV